MYRIIEQIQVLIDFCYPRLCVGCECYGSFICNRCAAKLTKIEAQECHVCRQRTCIGLVHRDCQETSYLDGVIAAYRYDGLAQKAIRLIKYSSVSAIASELGSLFTQRLFNYQLPCNIIVPVPLARFKHNYRGYNQTFEIAKKLEGGYQILNALKRKEHRAAQVGKDRIGRLQNLKGNFEFVGIYVPQSVMLLDDVMTTGATLEECAKVLKIAGVEKVYGLVFARG